jgi:hypothetical protein
MFNIVNCKPPINWRLVFYIVILNIHLFLLIWIYFDIKYLILIFIELFFYFLYVRKISKIFRILIIVSLIFLINVLFYEGKIIAQIGFIKITKEGLVNGLQKSGLLFALFLFTNNIFNNVKNSILSEYLEKSNSLIVLSIKYFYSFWEIIQNKISIKKLLFIVLKKYNHVKNLDVFEKKDYMDNKFIIYNVIVIIIFLILFIKKDLFNFI